ncbi:hypothetical protein Gotur_020911, partial [Gossypium turneri]
SHLPPYAVFLSDPSRVDRVLYPKLPSTGKKSIVFFYYNQISLYLQFLHALEIAAMDLHNLPFKVGQLVETRSFLQGYRGAWFRCKVYYYAI